MTTITTERTPMLYLTQITEIFVSIDDFYLQFSKEMEKHQLADINQKRNRASRMSASEVMTIMVLFHLSNFKDMKHFYLIYVQDHRHAERPERPRLGKAGQDT